MRRVIVGLVAVALAVGVVALWPRSTSNDPPSTTVEAPTTTSSPAPTSTSTTSTSLPETTTTVPPETNVVETVEEAEAILRELWFGWFEGIYNQDEDRIREVVVLEETVETARESFGVDFQRAPQPDDITFSETEILRSDEECLAVWAVMALDGFRTGTTDGVFILRRTTEGWQRLSTWIERGDLWEGDCESTLSSP